jgi:hypothetical protein
MAFPLKFNSRRFESFIKLDRSMLWNKFNKNCQLVIVNGIVKLRGVRHFKFCFDFIKTIDFNRPFRRTKSLKLIYKYNKTCLGRFQDCGRGKSKYPLWSGWAQRLGEPSKIKFCFVNPLPGATFVCWPPPNSQS